MRTRSRGGSTARRPGLTVAVVGADGAGKSTVTARLAHADLGRAVKVIYMGVNLDASSLMLPTTRVLLAVKRARGRRADMVASPLRDVNAVPTPSSSAKEAARLGVWLLEEWLRQTVATYYVLRGYIVIFDRHFFADYYHADVEQRGVRRSLPRRAHGWMLRHAYPRPDLMLMLDAPPEQLYLRKPEATVDWLEQRRREYLALSHVVTDFFVIDSDRPVGAVVTEAADLIRKKSEALA
jgi:thymidylate kinase